MGLFSRKPSQQSYINAVVKVATNLYLNSLSGKDGVQTNFQFALEDSRYRYLIFCLSSVFTSVLAYDDKKRVKPEELYNGCIQFARWAGNEYSNDYFNESTNVEDSLSNTSNIFQNYLKHWSRWPSLENEGKNDEIIELISTLIHFAESEDPISNDDKKRLAELSLEIDCRLLTMRSAVEELAKQ